jgi:hypothetical protein
MEDAVNLAAPLCSRVRSVKQQRLRYTLSTACSHRPRAVNQLTRLLQPVSRTTRIRWSRCLARALAPQVCDTLTGKAVLQRRYPAAKPSRCGAGPGPGPLPDSPDPEDSDGPAAPPVPLRSPTPPRSAISSWPAAPRAAGPRSLHQRLPLGRCHGRAYAGCRPAQRTRCNDGSESDLKACLAPAH